MSLKALIRKGGRALVISRLLYLRIIHIIPQAASGPCMICNYSSEQSSRYNNVNSKKAHGPELTEAKTPPATLGSKTGP